MNKSVENLSKAVAATEKIEGSEIHYELGSLGERDIDLLEQNVQRIREAFDEAEAEDAE